MKKINKKTLYENFHIYSLIFLSLLFPYLNIGNSIVLPTLYPLLFSATVIYLLKYPKKRFSYPLLFLILASIVIVISIGLYKNNEEAISYRLIILFTLLFFIYYTSLYIVNKAKEYSIDQVAFENKIINVIVLNSIIIIMLNLKLMNLDFFYSIIETNPRVFEYPIPRYPGFAFDAFSYVSVLHAFGLCLLIHNFLIEKINFSSFLFKGIIIFTAIVLSGRAGILIVTLFFIMCSIKLRIRLLILISICAIGVLTLSYTDLGQYEWIKNWAFGFIKNLLARSDNIDSSVNGVINHIFFPNNFIIGDKISFLSVNSDLGFIRLLVSSGIIGITLFLFYFLFLISLSYKSCDKLVLFFLLSILLLNCKDVYFISPYGVTFFLLFYILSKKHLKILKIDHKG
ncbi:hypothetical protein [Xenorhabdus bharatensis]|uniref:hypothetical protein n=1 Tax=Xenorhabdus bharatensis TaxID=3136256 RepID=UPI0030F40023